MTTIRPPTRKYSTIIMSGETFPFLSAQGTAREVSLSSFLAVYDRVRFTLPGGSD